MTKFPDLNLPEALEAALEAAEHLTDADAAAVAATRLMAKKWAEAADSDGGSFVFGAPHFRGMLDALVMTPKGRLEAAINQTDKRSKVADMKAERERRRSKSA